MSLEEIWGVYERRRELEKQTPPVVYKRREGRGGKYVYTDTRLGHILAFVDKDGRKDLYMEGEGWSFNPGVVRYATPELCTEIERIDAEITTLKEKRQALLKDKFLGLPSIPFEEILKTTQNIGETLEKGHKPD
jgi:hypothetical protein